jgi:hypothetical protein
MSGLMKKGMLTKPDVIPRFPLMAVTSSPVEKGL